MALNELRGRNMSQDPVQATTTREKELLDIGYGSTCDCKSSHIHVKC
jgi:hypothetical protein